MLIYQILPRLKRLSAIALFIFLSNVGFSQSTQIIGEELSSALEPRTGEAEVIIDYKYISEVSTDWGASLQIELLNGLQISVQNRFERKHPNGARTWTGDIVGQDWGYVILTEYHGVVFGKVEEENGSVFLIQYDDRLNAYILKSVFVEDLEEGNCYEGDQFNKDILNEPTETSRALGSGICSMGATCDKDTVDVLIFYTDSARTLLGGTDAAAIAACVAGIAEVNMANDNNSIDHVFLLAEALFLDYTESGNMAIDITAMGDDDDGVVDEVVDYRDQYFADFVHMIVGYGGCGIGNLRGDPDFPQSQTAYSVSRPFCFTSNKTFTHELGHNLGLRHDIYADTVGGFGPVAYFPCDFSFGFVNDSAFLDGEEPSERWRTIMAYTTECVDRIGDFCFRTLLWSDPDTTYLDDPAGIPIGMVDEAFNAFVVERSICDAAYYREQPAVYYSSTLQMACETYDDGTDSGVNTSIDFDGIDTFNRASPFGGDVTLCVTFTGDIGSPGESFTIKDEDGMTLGGSFTGTVGADEDCSAYGRVCFTLSAREYNLWIEDDMTEVVLDPDNTSVNPNLCRENRSCAEFYVPENRCHPGGTYTGIGVNGELLLSGEYTFTSEVTLKNWRVPAGEKVILKSEFDINLDESFIVEDGAYFETIESGCN